MRAAFGSDAKAIQVGLAAAAGVHAALAAEAGARVARDVVVPAGFAQTFGGTWAEPDPVQPAIAENWIKPWPCCLMAHSAIEAALQAGEAPDTGEIEVAVHPRARQAAAYDEPADGLQAKFSIPYLVAFALLRGDPEPASFDAVDLEVAAFATERVALRIDDSLGETEARLLGVSVRFSPGSPQSPLPPERQAAKVRGLAGDALEIEDDRPAEELLSALS
jgi:2-methylcitrate dehydratase PrpD